MIDIIQAPGENKVIADGNETVITVQSTSAEESYLQFDVFINEEITAFRTLSVSRNDAGKASLSLKRFYDDYFTNPFIDDLATGFRALTGLQIKMKIVVTEKKIFNDAVVDTVTLPEFYVIKAALPMEFSGTGFQLLDMPVREVASPPKGAIKFPFFCDKDVTASVYDDAGAAVYAETLVVSSRGIFEFIVNLSSLPISDTCAWVTVSFRTSGLSSFNPIAIPIIRDSIFPVKQVFFQNNCGAYVVRWLDGSFKDERKLSPQNYLLQNNSEVTYEIGEEAALSLNSGFHSLNTKADILAIAKSTDVRLKINSKWLRVAAATKKVGYFEDGEYLYEDRLLFSRVAISDATSQGAYMTLPKVSKLDKTAYKNEVVNITKQAILSHYTSETAPEKIRFRTSVNNGQYGYEDDNSVYHTISKNSLVQEASFNVVEIPWEEFTSVKYMPNPNASGIPVDVIHYQLFNGQLWSEVAQLNITMTVNPSGNRTPIIIMDGKQFIFLDENGDGSMQVAASITDPNGDPMTILWSTASDDISFDDATVEEPTITITGASAEDSHTITVKVTDTVSGDTTEQTLDLVAKLSAPSISSVFNAAESDAQNKIYDITVANGIENKTVTLAFNGYFAGKERFAVVDAETGPTPPLLSDGFKKIDIEKTFDASGEVNTRVILVDETESDIIELTVSIKEVNSGMIIGSPNQIMIP